MTSTDRKEALFRDAFERHYNAVLAYAMRRTAARHDAEEIVATTFATAWRRIDDMAPEPMTRAWLFRVAWRNLSNHHRGESRRARLFERLSNLGPAQLTMNEQTSDDAILYEALGQLSRKDQEVLRLVTWEELSNAEAAEVLGCSQNAFAIRLHRARHALRNELEKRGARLAERDGRG